MDLTSPAFEDSAVIPAIHTVDGPGQSPPLTFGDVPPDSRSLVLIMDDPDVPLSHRADGMFDHWVVWNIPPDCRGVQAGERPPGESGNNTAGKPDYFPPSPPFGQHRYYFRLYALDTWLSLPAGSTKQAVLTAIDGHVIAQAQLLGLFR